MMLNAEFIDRIAALAQGATAIKVCEVDGVEDKVLVQSGGAPAEWIDKPPGHECPDVTAFDDFVSKAHAMGSETGEVYFNQHALVGLADAKVRRDYVTMDLLLTDQARTLQSLRDAPRRFSHPREAVRFLRFDLPGAVPEATRRALSKVSFKKAASGEASAWHGTEHLGRSVTAMMDAVEAVGARIRKQIGIPTYHGCP